MECAIFADDYQTHVFLGKGHLEFLPNMLWMKVAVGELVQEEHLKPGMDNREEDIRFYDTAVSIVLLEFRRRKLDNTGFTFLYQLADP